MSRLPVKRRFRTGEKGAAMVEALLSFFILFLVLLGMLHVFYFFTGQFFTDYAALRGARSRTVGFADYLVERESRVNAIGASGRIISPRLHNSGTKISGYEANQFTMEKTLIQRYMVGTTWLEYEYWFGNPGLKMRINDSGLVSNVTATFMDYIFPLSADAVENDPYGNSQRRKIRMFFNGIDLRGSASLGNHSKVYLED